MIFGGLGRGKNGGKGERGLGIFYKRGKFGKEIGIEKGPEGKEFACHVILCDFASFIPNIAKTLLITQNPVKPSESQRPTKTPRSTPLLSFPARIPQKLFVPILQSLFLKL